MTLPRSVHAVSLGLGIFADALRNQGVEVAEVDWRPPAGGHPDLLGPLTRLWGEHGDRVAAANAEVVSRIDGCVPEAVTVAPARAVVPGLHDGVLLHSGPPI